MTPAFDPDVTEYAVSTSNATNTITAVPYADDAEMTITVNDEEIESGDSVTWDSGENEVVVEVKHTYLTKTYTIAVTKTEASE